MQSTYTERPQMTYTQNEHVIQQVRQYIDEYEQETYVGRREDTYWVYAGKRRVR